MNTSAADFHRYRKTFKMLGYALVFGALLPSAVYANFIEKKISDSFWGMIAQMVDDFAQNMFAALHKTVYAPVAIDTYFSVSQYVYYAQLLAVGWLSFVLVTKAAQGYFDQVYGEITPGELIQRAILGYGMIYLFPWLIENLWLKANAMIVEAIFSLQLTSNPENTLSCYIQTTDPIGYFIVMSLITVGFGCFLMITGLIRCVEIIGFYMFSPVIATSLAYKGDLFALYCKELTAVVFSQVWQVTCVYLALGQLNCADGLDANILVWATLFVAIKGPSFLKGWAYYSSGMGKSVSRGAYMAIRFIK